MNPEKKLAELEALLFIHGEPMTFKKIGKVLDVAIEEAKNLVAKLAESLSSAERGLGLITDEEKVQMVTKAEFGKLLESFAKEELSEELTPASLEALSLITYLGPVQRNKLEYIRGVNSSFTLRNLLLRGLIERSPDPQNLNIYLYEPSFELLKHLGISKKEDLPDYEKFRKILEIQQEQV